MSRALALAALVALVAPPCVGQSFLETKRDEFEGSVVYASRAFTVESRDPDAVVEQKHPDKLVCVFKALKAKGQQRFSIDFAMVMGDWLLAEEVPVQFIIDGERHLEITYWFAERKVLSAGVVMEQVLYETDFQTMAKLASASSCRFRIRGKNRNFVGTLSPDDLAKLKGYVAELDKVLHERVPPAK